jgi:hypothetical protein
MTTTTKITDLPVLASPTANGSNTIFVVVDKSSGTPTTKQITLQSLDSFVDNIGPLAFTHANSAFDKANSANTLAQSGYDKANSANVIAQAGWDKANSANVLAQAAYDQANTDATNITITAGSHGNATYVPAITVTANGRISAISNTIITGFANSTYAASGFAHANAAFDKANSANVLAQAAYDAANIANSGVVSTAFAHANAAFDKANSANVLAQAAYDNSNTDVTTISITAGSHGNATFVPVITLTANGRVSSISNTEISGFANSTYATASFDKANSANVLAQAAFNQANTANTTANTANVSALAAFDKANSANVLAQNAYNYANTISISINDAFITASRNTANSAFAHANGAFNAANTATSTAALSWLTANTAETTSTASFTKANAAFDKANSANVIAQSAWNQGNIATPAFAHANAAFDKANSANVIAQSAFDAANTAQTTGQAGFNKANSANTLAQSAYDYANTVFTHANAAFNSANTNTTSVASSYNHANGAYNTANTALTLAASAVSYDNLANAAYDQANTAYTTAFAASVQANTKVSKSGDTMTGDLKFNGNGGILNLPTNQIAITANVDNDVSGLIAFATGVSTVYANTDVIIQANTGGVTSYNGISVKDGTITFPDSTIQTTAFTANSLIVVASAPANNKGAGGDIKGMVYLANNYFYYCTANYDGTTNVWSRIASSDAW